MSLELQPDAAKELKMEKSGEGLSEIYLLSILISLYLAYPIVATLLGYMDIAREQGGESALLTFREMLFGYVVIWPFRIACIILLLKRKQFGWFIVFTFFVSEVVLMTLSAYSMWNYHNRAIGGGSLFGFVSNLTEYFHYYVYISLLAAVAMLWSRYREFFGITKQNVFACLAIGIIGGIIFEMITGM